ncbi:ISAs1 family transposase [Mesorhizobium waimense]|uniref:ISAs1 family transposase n=1 Tax=Mesorhizobium waimense TaxID=1300307 RepID=A0A3A5JKY9_9HYPH|nr:ISAs1 family transposase [Mesorhizobium waimense]RJT19290.1 ISAs1 family transposase [Mesorhizobium waimense]
MALLAGFGEKSRLGVLLGHFSAIEDPRPSHRVAYPLAEVLLLAVCGTIADCDDYEAIGLWGEQHLAFLRRFLPYHHGVPTGRWLTILMNRINPTLFSACFTDWVRACWPDRPELVAIDGKTSRRSHDRAAGQAPLHLVSAFATTSRLVLGQEAVADKSSELTAIPVLLERLAEGGGLKGAIVTIDAIACNGDIAKAVRAAGADYLLAVKANQPTLCREIEAFFADAPQASLDRVTDTDKGHGRIEQRTVTVTREVEWLSGDRRFPGELRLPDVAAIIKVQSKAELKDRCRLETRYYITSAKLTAEAAADAVRGHWGIENQLHWVLDVVFNDDQSRTRKGHGAKNMAVVRHFAINHLRQAPEPVKPANTGLRRKTQKPPAPRPTSLKLRRKIAGWDLAYLTAILQTKAR